MFDFRRKLKLVFFYCLEEDCSTFCGAYAFAIYCYELPTFYDLFKLSRIVKLRAEPPLF